MAESSFPFTSVNGDRVYQAKDFRKVNRALTNDTFCILGNEDEFQFSTDTKNRFTGILNFYGFRPTTTSGNGGNLIIGVGKAFIYGTFYENNSPKSLAITQNTGAVNRKDLVVIQYDLSPEKRNIELAIVLGDALGNTPEILNGEDFAQVPIGELTVNAYGLQWSYTNTIKPTPTLGYTNATINSDLIYRYLNDTSLRLRDYEAFLTPINSTSSRFVGATSGASTIGLYGQTGWTGKLYIGGSDFNTSYMNFGNNGIFLNSPTGNPGGIYNNSNEGLDLGGSNKTNRFVQITSDSMYHFGMYSPATTGVPNMTIASNGKITRTNHGNSSIRYKYDITNLEIDALSIVKDLRPIKYTCYGDESKRRQIGLIAEEVKPLIPELTFDNEEGEVDGIFYDRMVTLLVKSIQEQQELIVDLQSRLSTLEGV
jgi:hypothetical protein